jgi:tRNA 5-methylaminomethyl-2-thiouridine biosynthesis bifunctional protein
MPASSSPVTPAVLQFNAQGLPVSEAYGDIYRPAAGPFDQARKVFLQGNGLPERWAGRRLFTVCETGFGLGHNFLALWQAWRNDPSRCRHLHFVSFEAHPFRAEDMLSYYGNHLHEPERSLGLKLARSWPVPVPGVHRMQFDDGAVCLTVFFGPVSSMLRQLEARVDAFFLDGFAPRVNPDMWSRQVFSQLVRVASDQATAATWCSAGAVRRALQDEGFLVRKVAGFGGKSQITMATLRAGLGRAAAVTPPDQAIVVGAGIAGAATAHALAERGCRVRVFDPALAIGPGASHTGHIAAAVSPMFNRVDDPRARLSRAAVLRAWRHWQALDVDARPLVCGTFYPALSPDDALARQAVLQVQQLASDWVRWLSPQEAASMTAADWPYGGIWFPFGQRVSPPALITALLRHPNIQCAAQSVAGLSLCSDEHWRVLDAGGGVLDTAPVVVLCNAAAAPGLLKASNVPVHYPRFQELSSVAGEVYSVPEACLPDLQAIVAGHGYALPAVDGRLVLGSTYRRNVPATGLSAEGREQVLKKMQVLFGALPHDGLRSTNPGLGPVSGWAGWRASVSDRFPVVGPLSAAGLWVNACHASRGFSWSALAADVLVAFLYGEPLPLERDLYSKMLPR